MIIHLRPQDPKIYQTTQSCARAVLTLTQGAASAAATYKPCKPRESLLSPKPEAGLGGARRASRAQRAFVPWSLGLSKFGRAFSLRVKTAHAVTLGWYAKGGG